MGRITKDIDISQIKLQKEEVSDIKWFTKKEILDRINNNYQGITEKTGPWNFLKKYYEMLEKNIIPTDISMVYGLIEEGGKN